MSFASPTILAFDTSLRVVLISPLIVSIALHTSPHAGADSGHIRFGESSKPRPLVSIPPDFRQPIKTCSMHKSERGYIIQLIRNATFIFFNCIQVVYSDCAIILLHDISSSYVKCFQFYSIFGLPALAFFRNDILSECPCEGIALSLLKF